jgi:hypothetical protein
MRMTEAEKGWRKVVRSWFKYVRGIVDANVRTKEWGAWRFSTEMDCLVNETLSEKLNRGGLTEVELERIKNYINDLKTQI